ncbi:MAG TPA: indolepyruvate ferredoxin oxidoreductase family protein, partial [Conexibacter sp.]|nr:indolepyruvate ferredoxin oxidoreductase family protein [Conexibacter sp.]
YARLNDLNAVTHDAPGARLGVVVHGSARHELRAALAALGFGEQRPAPLRVLEIGMLFPLDEQSVRDFAAGLDEIVVVEEKGPFLERLVRDALYGSGATPPVFGKRDERGAPLLAAHGTLDADAIARALGARLLARSERARAAGAPRDDAAAADLAAVRARLELLDAVAARPVADLGAQRTPAFCSGCPHSVSTKAPADAIVGAGIGCHTMVLLDKTGRGAVAGITQMGGEGVQWVGAAPFAERRHFVQNLGDGTFHHSGSLAIRAAVAAGIDVTYKLLCNGTVAMTGGQQVEGQLPVPALVRSLAAEGVARIVVTAEDLSRYDGVDLGPQAELRPRSELERTQRELAKVEGVTVLIHDQACAAELRRARKRGLAPTPTRQVVINERVCEGCGDCGEKSGCLSVEPVATEFGRKTRINQDSCNSDLTCLEGECPSFMTVTPPRAPQKGTAKQRERALPAPPAMPEPTPIAAADDVRLRLVGIGGTGVVTVSQVLAMAALLDGRHSRSLDQTGLSQKAGPVVSDVRITSFAPEGGASAPAGGLDLLLGFDLLGAASAANLRAADGARTLAVVATDVVPTARMVRDANAPAADVTAATGAIDAVTRAADNVYLDAHALARELFQSDSSANVIVLGAAWQQGAIPLTRTALHEAFRLNGAAVERNVAAFEWGRACVVAPEAVAALRADRMPRPASVRPSARERALIAQAAPAGSELERLLELRVEDLRGWGGRAVAARYAETVADVAHREQAALPGSSAVAEAVARNLHRVLAYKDEYEVARLHVATVAELPRGTRVAFHLHPPALRALGLRRKLELGRWFLPALRLLAHGRRLRGTPLDPFGRAEVRRVERALPDEYLALVDGALARLTPATLALALEAAELPELVRGYEEIKLRGVTRFRARAQELRAALDADTEARPPAAPQSHDEEPKR